MMKIKGTRSYVLIEYDHRILKIQGELTVTAFFANLNSIDCWKSPFDNIKVTNEEKGLIVKKIQVEQEEDPHKLKIFFE